MRQDLTDITVIMDRSGSMIACKNDAQGGINSFVENQKKEPGNANFTLVQFNTTYEIVHDGINLQNVPHITLNPAGGTALLDAVGRAIITVGDRLKGVDEKDRPGLVVFVIVTDGEENSSHEFTKEKIKEMIQHQTDVYKWQFTFLGANIDAFHAAQSIGILRDATLKYSEEKTSGGYLAASANVARMRGASAQSMPVNNAYSDEERWKVK